MTALAASVVREALPYEKARGGQHVAPLTRRGPDGASSRHHGAAPLDTKGRGAGASPPSMIMKPPSSRAGVRAPRGAADHTVADASSLADFAEQGIPIGDQSPVAARPGLGPHGGRPRVARSGCRPGAGLAMRLTRAQLLCAPTRCSRSVVPCGGCTAPTYRCGVGGRRLAWVRRGSGERGGVRCRRRRWALRSTTPVPGWPRAPS